MHKAGLHESNICERPASCVRALVDRTLDSNERYGRARGTRQRTCSAAGYEALPRDRRHHDARVRHGEATADRHHASQAAALLLLLVVSLLSLWKRRRHRGHGIGPR